MAILELHELSKWYGEVIGLNHVSARIGSGITGLLGPNGAGKSTLMGLATGQLRPSKGTICLLGSPVWDRPKVLSRIGYCPEGDRFWPGMTGFQFVRFLAMQSGLSRQDAATAAKRAIEIVRLSEHMHRAIRGYSKGMRQRIKVAQALAHQPELLILDEPFTGADPVARHELADLFRTLAGQGVNVLISSHVLHEVEALTTRIIMIDHGRVVAQGDLHDIRQRMHNRPHTVRVRVNDPRCLAARLAELDCVAGLHLHDGGVLLVETKAPEQLHERLMEIALAEALIVRELTPADENLEAVFGYLTQRSA